MKLQNNKKQGKILLIFGLVLLMLFAVFTVLIKSVDVKPLGVNGTNIGFSTLNTWLHSITGVNWALYNITDWPGLVPVFCCMDLLICSLLYLLPCPFIPTQLTVLFIR